jgi:hypothetical protein
MADASPQRYDRVVRESPYRLPSRPVVERAQTMHRPARAVERRPTFDWWTFRQVGLWTVRIAIRMFGGV